MNEFNNTWTFPQNIGFDMVPSYSMKFEKISHNETILFDLSKTESTHSSFIGFLIYAKQKMEISGGNLVFKISSPFEKLLNMLHLIEFLTLRHHIKNTDKIKTH
ncbi:MAG: hypothetical protein SVR08_10235 [Spirochaetota bacterium]|nr:hypothetical protein [Spirochaetota bacterium]